MHNLILSIVSVIFALFVVTSFFNELDNQIQEQQAQMEQHIDQIEKGY